MRRTTGHAWRRSEVALDLVDQLGGPFSTAAFRSALAATTSWRDHTVGAELVDGTLAALPVMSRLGVGVSMPQGYGGVVSTRPLTGVERGDLLAFVLRQRRLRRVIVRELDNGGTVAETAVVHLDPTTDPMRGFHKNVRRYVGQAARRGVYAQCSGDAEAFLSLYLPATANWTTRYDPALITRVVSTGAARVYGVMQDGSMIGAALALIGRDHWMYWLGAQNDAGRALKSGYVAVAALIDDAWRSGAHAVNLGASATGGRALPGVATFKERFDATPVAVGERVVATSLGRVEQTLHARWRAHRDARIAQTESGKPR